MFVLAIFDSDGEANAIYQIFANKLGLLTRPTDVNI